MKNDSITVGNLFWICCPVTKKKQFICLECLFCASKHKGGVPYDILRSIYDISFIPIFLFTVKRLRFEIYALVHRFNNRWRWCCGHFNLWQRTLELGYQRSLSRQDLFHSLDFRFFHNFRLIKTKYLFGFREILRLVSR